MTAKPDAQTLAGRCPEIDPAFVQDHVARMEAEYFAAFDAETQVLHLRRLHALTPSAPVRLEVGAGSGGTMRCTVFAFDYPGEFALICGLFSATGFHIHAGTSFTSARAAPWTPGARLRPDALARAEWLRRRRIVDTFDGVLDPGVDAADWQRTFTHALDRVVGCLERGTPDDSAAARNEVNELVARRLALFPVPSGPVLYPVELAFIPGPADVTRMRVMAQDTPAFLYSLAAALALRGITIERVTIRTHDGRVEDLVDIVDRDGQPIRDPQALDTVRMSVLMTKQFTYFLAQAPAPFAALSRFERLIDAVLGQADAVQRLQTLSAPAVLQDLARLLGASDFLWEDFIRLQYEALFPVLGNHAGPRPSFEREALAARREDALATAAGDDAFWTALNAWKDHEIAQIDMDHILHEGGDVRALAQPLTMLAELVVEAAVARLLESLACVHGRPRTVAGIEAHMAVFGLGKMGGMALGYASDIELLFVYDDNGQTDGSRPITNAEFFDRLAGEVALRVEARREGVFQVDLRLRPYGAAGPRACSLENFCRYYGPGGPALSYERLALTRLRRIAGDADLGARVERLRDEFVYVARSIATGDITQLRERQYEQKGSDAPNAKFSAGALVDVEYCVQMLQVLHGGANPALRTPRIRDALQNLGAAGILAPGEADRLVEAYEFLRRLINGLRMLRGNARDLFLPPARSTEHLHLARRMGYPPEAGTTASLRLFSDFETHTAVVRTFLERHFGRDAVPNRSGGTVADVLLSRELTESDRHAILANAGFQEPAAALAGLRSLQAAARDDEAFLRLAVLACDTLRGLPDPDRALGNWDRLVGRLAAPAGHFRLLLSQPRRIEIQLALFSSSQFLTDLVIRDPELLDWIAAPEALRAPLVREALLRDLESGAPRPGDHDAWLDRLRRFRRRQMLRIAARDICLAWPFEGVVTDLSHLAEVVTEAALRRETERHAHGKGGDRVRTVARQFCIVAFGKLGGEELNYSSDIDLLGIYDEAALDGDEAANRDVASQLMDGVRAALAAHTGEGYAYRVDLRLRPHGGAGLLAQSLGTLRRYYEQTAAPWEIQAALKARPVAGNLAVGSAWRAWLHGLLQRTHAAPVVFGEIRRLRQQTIRALGGRNDVKTGRGGIRDLEFLVQGLQLVHVHAHPRLHEGNTLRAVGELEAAGLLPAADAAEIRELYVFMRRVEHCLQVLDDRQTHELPSDPGALRILARRLLDPAASAAQLVDRVEDARRRIAGWFDRYAGGEGASLP